MAVAIYLAAVLCGAALAWCLIPTDGLPDRDEPRPLRELRAQLRARARPDAHWVEQWMLDSRARAIVWDDSIQGDEMVLALCELGEWETAARALEAVEQPPLTGLRGRRRVLARILLGPESWLAVRNAARELRRAAEHARRRNGDALERAIDTAILRVPDRLLRELLRSEVARRVRGLQPALKVPLAGPYRDA